MHEKTDKKTFSLEITAGREAFGDGNHASTKLALALLEGLQHYRGFQNGLDLGCGSGLLALYMAYFWHIPVLATDIEKTAIQATLENAQANHLSDLVSGLHADGLAHPEVQSRAPYDMICCNILADWQAQNAPALRNAMADESLLILSGILSHQTHKIIEIYQQVGLTLLQKISVQGWDALLWQKQDD